MTREEKSRVYLELEVQLRSVVAGGIPWESKISSLIALVKERFPLVSWVGIYRAEGKSLWVGPYQGKLACILIPPGKGVCGRSFQEKRVLIVPDVEKFDGHIACDALSRSEIVIPVYRDGECVGVLDLDSHQLSAFDEVDQKGLEALLACL